jgi:cytochrome c oxidase subunit 2
MPMLTSRPPRLTRRRATLACLPVIAALVAGCAQSFPALYPPAAATTEGHAIRELYDIVFYLAVAIFLVVEAAIIYAVLRYRRRPGDDELPAQTHGNNLVEIIWTVVPTLIVAFLFFISWQTLNKVDTASASPANVVRATAARFQWTFQYFNPDGSQAFETFSEMYIPVGEQVQVRLHSPDVIHAFYVPRFLFKKDVVPGPKENVFDFTVDPDEAGQTFRGQCAELCGPFHGAMIFSVHAVTRAEYDQWFAEQVANANRPSPSPAASGAPAGETLVLVAKNTSFDKKELRVPAGQPFSIELDNQDPGILHNVEVKDPAGTQVFLGDFVTGPDKRTYPVPPLQPGTYTFLCTVHPIPAMTGTLTVE